MKISEIRKALESRLKEAVDAYNIANSTTVPVKYENIKLDLNGVQKWVRATVLPNNTVSVGVSKHSPDLYQGLFQIDVFTQKEIGSQEGLALLSFIANYFKKGLTLIFLDIKINVEQFNVLPSDEEDNYFRLSARVSWYNYIFDL